MINNIVIVGRLTKDPKLFEKEETYLTTFCVAIERNYKDRNQNNIVDFIYCKSFGKVAQNIVKYVNQGSLVAITGQMQSRKYVKDDQTHFISELYVETIKFLTSKHKDEIEPHTTKDNQEILEDTIQDSDLYEII